MQRKKTTTKSDLSPKLYEIKPQQIIQQFLDEYQILFAIDREKSLSLIKSTLAYYNGNKEKRDELVLFQDIENQWYDGLKDGVVDYSVYDHEYYFTDILCCWVKYSREYIKAIVKANNLKDGGTLFDGKNIDSVVDLGCGLGYATASLKQVFPKAEVYGTNLKGTRQWKYCETISKKYHFNLVEDIKHVQTIDVVFASEYFEHIQNPIEHLVDDILSKKPKIIITANAFNTRSIGHFEEYQVYDKNTNTHKTISQSKISKLFNDTLIQNGYERVKTKFWNNRPQVFQIKGF